MADSKKYNGSTWEHSLRKLATATDTFTTLPVDVYADGNNATVGISGNMEQNGTPTPDNPIQPQETGDRTANLFDKNTITPDKFVATGGEISSTNYYCSDYIPVSEGAYYLANVVGGSVQQGYVVYDSNKQAIRQGTISGGKSASGVVNISANEYYIRINMHIETSPDVVMVNSGSTALPYEPFGYEIPISSANTSTPVYLGEVETTRKIKKYEFTGQETFSKTDSTLEVGTAVFSIRYDAIGMEDIINYNEQMANIPYPFFYSSHFLMKTQTGYGTLYTDIKNGEIGANNNIDGAYNRYIIFASNQYTTAADFKTYLQQQYANGTPVTVWYVLATPTTGIVNEPIRKIGDYADTVSGITIPTTEGADSFDVLTTLKPSEVSLSYTGWHDATVEEWDGSQWNE